MHGVCWRVLSPGSVAIVAALLGACDSDASTESEAGAQTGEETSGSRGAESGTNGEDGPDVEDSGSDSDSGVDSSGGNEGPTCDDRIQNGDERGVDCGGSCSACAPAQWTCEAGLYGDGVCHCGCDVVDLDCDSTALSACAYEVCPRGRALRPGQTLQCVEVPPTPEGWSCGAARYGDSECDCGCGAVDFDCESADAPACTTVHCPESFTVDGRDNATCVPPPSDAVDNASFEDVPAGPGDVPGWMVLDDIGGSAQVEVSGPGQTTAPDGSRALRLQSTSTEVIGARTVRSSAFLPPAGTCTVTVAVGDSNEDAEFTDFGHVRVRVPSLPAPLDLVAEVEIDNRGNGGVSPPTDGYVDAALTFATDGEAVHHVDIRVRGSLGTLSYHADDVRIDCTAG